MEAPWSIACRWLSAVLALVLCACSGGGSARVLEGVWWPPATPRSPERLALAAPDEPDPLAWWRLNIASLVPPGIYADFRQSDLAEQIVAETNSVRARYGLAPVARDARLDRVAQAHALDCAVREYWSHRTPEGLASRDRVEAALGVVPTAGAENSSAGIPGEDSGREIVRSWELSSGHRELLLSSEVRLIGVGVYTYRADELEHVVQLLVDLP